ncbi:MAG TPA: wax ester/triacylglycerol synthase family O-acyltransferase [Acidimicrobiia bacterium]
MSDIGPGRQFDLHMSDADALMWNIEKDPVLRSTIVAVGILDGPPDFKRLRRRYEQASRTIPRLRQRVLTPPMRIGPPRWADDPHFDLDFHLRRIVVPPPGSQRRLLDFVGPIAQASFDRARPLWETTVVEGLDNGRAAVVMKVHHSVTDGVGGVELLAQLVDLEPGGGNTISVHERDHQHAPTEALEGGALVRDSIVHTTRRWMGIARRAPTVALDTVTSAARDPFGSAVRAVDTARSVGRAVAPASSPMSPLMTRRGLGRRLDAFDVSLDDLRRAAKRAECSLNDAFVAAVIGGLANYHATRGAAVDELRMTLPINIRHEGSSAAGNHFAPARFAVPAAIVDPVERMHAVGALVRAWRREPALALTDTLAGVLNRLPTSTTTALFGGMLKCIDFVTSNVPGAPLPVYLGGAEVERLYAFGPPSGAAVNVTLLSHVDTCCIGVVSDTTAVPDGSALLDELQRGFDEVLAAQA